jgi:glycosyltransferase involved in cell wall biosynthesis
MDTFLIILAGCTLAIYCSVAQQIILGNHTIDDLHNIPPLTESDAPSVSFVIAACNEERSIESALTSVLRQDYPTYEVIVVNDRSTDKTGEILERLAAGNSRLRVLSVERLPPGWLGKNYALHQGALRASGSLVVFSDADIVMHPSVLGRTVRYLLDKDLDHLAVPPRVVLRGFLLNLFLPAFGLLFVLYAQPWKAKDPKSSKHIGIGAYNLVRTAVYRAIGGHERIAMRPDDDMKLGKLIKLQGYRQDLVLGTKRLSVEWYANFRELIEGLMKNMFAGVEYSVSKAIMGSIVQFLVNVWPFLALLVTSGWPRVLNILIIVAIYSVLFSNSERLGIRRPYILGFPLAILMFIYILLRSMVLTLRNDGINWRGTHYSLDQLRANRL